MVMTRPDVAFPVSVLCRHMQNPSLEGYHAALSVASYLHATSHLGITFGGLEDKQDDLKIDGCKLDDPDVLIAFADASWGREAFPMAGGFLRWRRGPLAWMARQTKIPPQSSCEAEVGGLVPVLKEGVFAKQNIDFIGSVERGRGSPIHSVTDSKSAYDVIKNPGATKRTVHFDRWLHFARELYLRNGMKIFLTTTDKMMADMFTKAVDKTTFLRCRKYVMNLLA